MHKSTKNKPQNETGLRRAKAKGGVNSYRLKCAQTANGLSHFVMYGDVPKEKTLL